MAEGSGSGLVRLPASGCRSFYQGRCLYEEQLNPGLCRAWRCTVQAYWEKVYDDFLTRAENFGLDEAELSRLWRLRFERLCEEPIACPDFAPGPVESMPECLQLFVDICLLRLPVCTGHCVNYRQHAKA